MTELTLQEAAAEINRLNRKLNEQMVKEINIESAIQRAYCEGYAEGRQAGEDSLKAELEETHREIERLGEIVTECDGVECVKHDLLVRGAMAELAQADQSYAKQVAMTARIVLEKEELRKALEQYSDPANWRFEHDADNRLIWKCKLGPTLAYDALRTDTDEQKGASNASR